MSQENVEIVRNVYAMLGRGDAATWDVIPSDFVFDFSRRLIDPVRLCGPDEMRAFYRDLDSPWAGGARLEIEELIDAGDKVLALIRFGGRGKMSGAAVEALVWNVWTFRNGTPVEWTYFGEDRAAALKAVGLSE
jgi:ketosteroid isomerase-like protein